jgi:hypothetical protein
MSEFIGVRTSLDYMLPDLLNTLKRDALVVDRIAIPNLNNLLDDGYEGEAPLEFKGIIRELTWLRDQKILFQGPDVSTMLGPILGDDFNSQVRELKRLGRELEGMPTPELGISNPSDFGNFVETSVKYNALKGRLAAIYLREKRGMEAYPWSDLIFEKPVVNVFSDVLVVVLNSLPVPDEVTPWEQVLEYRADPDSKSKFLALRKWMRDISKRNLQYNEIEEELEFLMDEYQRHMELHKLKTKTSTLEMLVVTTAELLENLVTVKWGEVAKKLFFLRHQKIALMEAEITSPGREVAFIRKVREQFGA